MNLEEVERILRKCWRKDTCYPPWSGKWSKDNPSVGQGVVTALVVQDIFGGIIVNCIHSDHYWNVLPDGKEADLAKDQFGSEVKLCRDGQADREELLYGPGAAEMKTAERYHRLQGRFFMEIDNDD